MLVKNPADRLGCSLEGANEIKAHSFFNGIVWDDVYFKRIPVPDVPIMDGELDSSRFHEDYTSQEIAFEQLELLSQEEQDHFKDFRFLAEDAQAARTAASKSRCLIL